MNCIKCKKLPKKVQISSSMAAQIGSFKRVFLLDFYISDWYFFVMFIYHQYAQEHDFFYQKLIFP